MIAYHCKGYNKFYFSQIQDHEGQAPSTQGVANVSSRTPLLTPVKSPRKRKRKSHIKKVEIRKKRRNEGRAYHTKLGKNIPTER